MSYGASRPRELSIIFNRAPEHQWGGRLFELWDPSGLRLAILAFLAVEIGICVGFHGIRVGFSPAAYANALFGIRRFFVDDQVVLEIVTSLALFAAGCKIFFISFWRTFEWVEASDLGVRRLIRVDEIDTTDVMTLAEAREHGWPEKMIYEVLGPPDFAVLDTTGRHPPLIMLSRHRLEEAERSGKFDAYRRYRHPERDETSPEAKWLNLKQRYDRTPIAGTADEVEEELPRWDAPPKLEVVTGRKVA